MAMRVEGKGYEKDWQGKEQEIYRYGHTVLLSERGRIIEQNQ